MPIGRTTEAYVRGEKEASLSCADRSSGGINGEEAEREGNGGGESIEAEYRAGGACIADDRGGACVASKDL
uniref:Ubiquitin-protein ligase n=1 Tax=Solanum tuberosum TaxID=4113 RepID=M1BU23_SOLTU